jgi:hypothetical protein
MMPWGLIPVNQAERKSTNYAGQILVLRVRLASSEPKHVSALRELPGQREVARLTSPVDIVDGA